MMDFTDRHCRYFLRLLSQHTLLYTEMITTGAILKGDRQHLLGFHTAEHPLALQLGGSNPAELARCARIARDWGYAEVNLNLGCPSDRVQNGAFGACLMAEPDLVAACVSAMRDAVSIPVTVKTRIGIDDQDSYEFLAEFVERIAAAGCEIFIIHARKAILAGLSPKENREIPPLDYARVHRLKQDFPQLNFSINGGITSLAQAKEQLTQLDGVMIGREAYHNPYMLAQADALIFNSPTAPISRYEALERFIVYAEAELARGTQLKHMARHILGLFHGQAGARRFRRHISEKLHLPHRNADLLRAAAALVPA